MPDMTPTCALDSLLLRPLPLRTTRARPFTATTSSSLLRHSSPFSRTARCCANRRTSRCDPEPQPHHHTAAIAIFYHTSPSPPPRLHLDHTTSPPPAHYILHQNTYDSDTGNTTIEVSCFMEAFKEAREWVGLEFPVKSNVGKALYDWLDRASAYNQVACASNSEMP